MPTLLQNVLVNLGISDDPDCVTTETRNLPLSREDQWWDVRRRFGIDALYFRGGIPVAYFKELTEHAAADELFSLHRRLWNYNLAPLLVAVLPNEIRVYDCFRAPNRRGVDRALIATLALVGDVLDTPPQAVAATEPYAELGWTGAWLQETTPSRRVDRYLMRNLRTLRGQLMSARLDKRYANRLIMRCLLVRYLEANGRLRASQLVNLLGLGTTRTYSFFKDLAVLFNGDVLPVLPGEEEAVTEQHLVLMAEFLAATEMTSGQQSFWEYDFTSIPVELISSIYQEFLSEDQQTLNAYYTPVSVVNLILDRVLPVDGTGVPTVLDPACGSGVFLLSAFKRIVARWRRHHGRLPSQQELANLLSSHVFGVDKDADALSVTAFSCYLGMLEMLPPGQLTGAKIFPPLGERNLIRSDFFDVQSFPKVASFDAIVGNPPWGELTASARAYLASRQLPVSRNQIAHAFLWKAHELLARGGTLGLVLPSRTSLFATGSTSVAFRREVFLRLPVRLVIDLSDFQSRLFAEARQPAAVFIVSARDDGVDEQLQSFPDSGAGVVDYWALHRSPVGDQLPGLVLEGNEIHRVRVSEAIDRPYIWKTLSWGSTADYKLLKRLDTSYPRLGDVAATAGWLIAEGLQVGGGEEHEAPELALLPFLDVGGLRPFSARLEPPLSRRQFHRPRKRTRPVFTRAIRAVVSEGTDLRRAIAAAFVDRPLTFRDSIVGIASASADDMATLKCLVAVLNSSLAQYYLFLTGGQWGVERAKLEKQDFVRLPWPGLRDASPWRNEIRNQLANFDPTDSGWQQRLDKLVFDLYEVSSQERILVNHVLTGAVERYAQYGEYEGFHRADSSDLQRYADYLSETVRATLGRGFASFEPFLIGAAGGYGLIALSLLQPGSRGHTADAKDVSRALRDLSWRWSQQTIRSLYIRRNVKIIQPEAVHIVKPNELRYWTEADALEDADQIIVSMLQPFAKLSGVSASA